MTSLRKSVKAALGKSIVRDPKHLFLTERLERVPILSRIVLMMQTFRNKSGLPPMDLAAYEEISYMIYSSMEAPTRTFHNYEHLVDLAKGSDPLQVSAIAFHDIVYYSIDGGLSKAQRQYLNDVIVEHEDGSVSITTEKLDASIEMVMDVFGFKYGQVLNPYAGMNEFLSAVIGCRMIFGSCFDQGNSKNHAVKIVACIEATIPFRGIDDEGKLPPQVLFERLVHVNEKYNIGMDEDEIVLAVQRSCDLGNKDLENFSWKDHAAFLSNTWKLLPESNIECRTPGSSMISEWALAFKKFTGFFQHLNHENIYYSFRDPNEAAKVQKKSLLAKNNIEVALMYMNCEYLAMSILYAIAELSGGDAPLFLFQGDSPINPRRKLSIKLKDFLKYKRKPSKGVDCDKDVLKVLQKGRKEKNVMGFKNSPNAAFFYTHLGNEGVNKSLEFAVHPMDEANALKLLQSVPFKPMIQFLAACSKVAIIRLERIESIVERFSAEYIESQKFVDKEFKKSEDRMNKL